MVAMFKVLLETLTLSRTDANGLFGTTKISVFQPIQIYYTIKYRVHHMRPDMFFILHGKLKKIKRKNLYSYV